ncbi:uncharacterized protein LOC142221984 [Haematobia irritans]|uniref:uncharacterized protein LOC142221984 n=1 Tax=Haematobia irritans TaxID=7368 RepID=UPI003F4FACE5
MIIMKLLITISILLFGLTMVYSQKSSDVTSEMLHKYPNVKCPYQNVTCGEEEFIVQCMGKNNITQKCRNLWPSALPDTIVSSKKLCLLSTGMPLMRRCFYHTTNCSVHWEDMNNAEIICLSDIKQTIITEDLQHLLEELRELTDLSINKRLHFATKVISLLGKKDTKRITADLAITTDILQYLLHNVKETLMIPKVLKIVNFLMGSDDSILRSSRKLDINTRLIKIVEDFYDNQDPLISDCAETSNGIRHYLGRHSSIFYFNPTCANISGLVIYAKPDITLLPPIISDNQSDNFFRYTYTNETFQILKNQTNKLLIDAAVFTKPIRKKVHRVSLDPINTLHISLYRRRVFFVNQNRMRSVIIRISAPRFPEMFHQSELFVEFSKNTNTKNIKCSNWNYHDSNYGRVDTRPKKSSSVDSVSVRCAIKQIPSFNAVIYEKDKSNVDDENLPHVLTTRDNEIDGRSINDGTDMANLKFHNPENGKYETSGNKTQDLSPLSNDVDVYSLVACVLSLTGLLCIFVTAVIFLEWRLQFSNRLLLNICSILTLMMIYFLVISIPNIRKGLHNMEYRSHCMVMGAFVQYSILVLFLWMLFIAILQLYRYASVFGTKPHRHFIVRCAMAAWILPLIPTGLVLYFDPHSYTRFVENGTNEHILCCPTGSSFYYAVLIPICLIMFVDFIIFVYIIYQIFSSMRRFHLTQERDDVIVQVRQSILLIFVLSISWIFGIFSHMYKYGIFSELFCITSTMQGFFLFVYFVAFDGIARKSWGQYIRNICVVKNRKMNGNVHGYNEHSIWSH